LSSIIPDRLNDYLEMWELSNLRPLAATRSSHVYTVDFNGETAVLKLLTPIGEEEKIGAAALRYFDGYGAVRLLRGDDHAHLLEYADGDDLVGLVKSGKDEEATAIIGDVLNQLHSAYQGTQPADLMPLKEWFRSLFNVAEWDQREGLDTIYVRGAAVARELLDHPREETVLHGDIHHENIRYKAGRGWLAFDPKGLFGERTYDAANTFNNPLDMPDLVENEQRVLKTADILSQKLNIECSRILAYTFAYTCLSASWWREDGEEAEATQTLRVAEIVEPLLT
jgi:streptomycin 6-kinase